MSPARRDPAAKADPGRLLGLDRTPEVKTLRRKLAEPAGHGRGAQLQAALGAHHAQVRPDAVGFLYLGHVRVYFGTRQLPKTHTARMRIAGPATEETWVGDAEGDPVMVLTAAPSQSLAAELRRTLPDLRAVVGPDRRCTMVFDRGGYSPQVFVEIVAAGFDLLTTTTAAGPGRPRPAAAVVRADRGPYGCRAGRTGRERRDRCCAAPARAAAHLHPGGLMVSGLAHRSPDASGVRRAGRGGRAPPRREVRHLDTLPP